VEGSGHCLGVVAATAATTPELIVGILNSVFFKFFKFLGVVAATAATTPELIVGILNSVFFFSNFLNF